MGFQQTVYRSSRVRINVGGFQVSRGAGASGYAADGPFFKIAQSGPSFTTRRGVDGHENRADTNNRGVDFSIFTMSDNSETNGFLSGLITADENGDNGASIVSVVVDDMGGTTFFATDDAYLIQRPEMAFGAETVDLEWKFHGLFRVFLIGGN